MREGEREWQARTVELEQIWGERTLVRSGINDAGCLITGDPGETIGTVHFGALSCA